MKKFVLVLVGFFLVTTIIGCGKKKSEEANLDNMTNGVVSENVVSVNDMPGGLPGLSTNSAVPVIVDNAEAVPQTTGDMATPVLTGEKPTAKQIQQALKNAGFYKGKVDGNIGPKTKKAIEDFQTQSGLKADGKVGPKTWRALSPFLGQESEVENPTDQVQTVE